MKEFKIIFWDFDGVIKDSVVVKSIAFEQLFLPYGRGIADRVRQHHESNGGVSRYGKLPIYLRWAGEPATEEQVQKFCDRFSELALQAVIDSAWVPGVREYLQANHTRQRFVLVTATPHGEIQQILHALEIGRFFCEVHGAPVAKSSAIMDVLERWRCQPEQALMVGDSETDLEAAEENNVAFLLRRTPLNKTLQQRYSGPTFEALTHE